MGLRTRKDEVREMDASGLAQPEVLPVSGGWMAKSAPGSTLKLAVIEETREAALDEFERALAEWARLLREDDGA